MGPGLKEPGLKESGLEEFAREPRKAEGFAGLLSVLGAMKAFLEDSDGVIDVRSVQRWP